ncbi:PepSY domain-containing protein [Methylocystis sp. B8]|nr:PepSY domain-containing protein [Methylocystis sp. B8]
MRTLATCVALLGLVGLAATPAQADRLTRQEKSSLRTAMKDAQCSGGRMESRKGNFEIDNARCQNGRRYDLTFDQNFKLMNKEPEGRSSRFYGRHNKRENRRGMD